MARKFAYDYYDIELPTDLEPHGIRTDRIIRLSGHAIDQARDQARLHCIPCEWHSQIVKGDIETSFSVTFRVRRKRHKKTR